MRMSRRTPSLAAATHRTVAQIYAITAQRLCGCGAAMCGLTDAPFPHPACAKSPAGDASGVTSRGRPPGGLTALLDTSAGRLADLTGGYGVVLRLPACQSSFVPAVPGCTPKLRSWGRSRRLRLSSAKPGKAARAVTWSHSRTASSRLGSLLITGPNRAAPSGGLNWMIGVPTSLPVSASASSPSARIWSSHRVSSSASARPEGRPAEASNGSTNSRLPLVAAVSSAAPEASKIWPADGFVERSDGGPSVLGPRLRRDPQQPQSRGMPLLVAGREVAVVVDPSVDQAQRDEPPVDGVLPLCGNHAHPLARHPRERAHRVEVETDVRVGHAAAFCPVTLSPRLSGCRSWIVSRGNVSPRLSKGTAVSPSRLLAAVPGRTAWYLSVSRRLGSYR